MRHGGGRVGVDILIEPINRRDIPGFFLNKTHEARPVIHEVGEPNLGLQLDLYHRQIEEGDVATAIREFAPLTRHYQIASPPDRGEPDDGEMNHAICSGSSTTAASTAMWAANIGRGAAPSQACAGRRRWACSWGD